MRKTALLLMAAIFATCAAKADETEMMWPCVKQAFVKVSSSNEPATARKAACLKFIVDQTKSKYSAEPEEGMIWFRFSNDTWVYATCTSTGNIDSIAFATQQPSNIPACPLLDSFLEMMSPANTGS